MLCLLAAACGDSEFIVDDKRTYKEARSSFWRNLYPRDGVTLYCRHAFQTSQRDGINVEHVFPMSWATRALDCGKRKQCRINSDLFNFIEADMHNLYPARSDVNQDRSSFRFGDINGERRAYGQQCDFEVDARARVAEPPTEVRGEVARAMFYMAYQYQEHGLEIFKKQAKCWRNGTLLIHLMPLKSGAMILLRNFKVIETRLLIRQSCLMSCLQVVNYRDRSWYFMSANRLVIFINGYC